MDAVSKSKSHENTEAVQWYAVFQLGADGM